MAINYTEQPWLPRSTRELFLLHLVNNLLETVCVLEGESMSIYDIKSLIIAQTAISILQDDNEPVFSEKMLTTINLIERIHNNEF